ncbi:MAG TPA: anhydro-N-acetylmuramic acid kinase [Flavobacteriaceae bacterium]|nr:anhydro-N-acetylmuramic acid kinase [Flavobacteriaceae bacterium]
MLNAKYKVIGVMSGTSLDGIDLVSVTFVFEDGWTFKIHEFETIKYNSDWKLKLKDLVNISINEIKTIDEEYTLYLAEVINDFIEKHNIKDIDAVCSHGHTALHQPDKGITYQIGNLPKLTPLVKQKVVCDFRTQDVQLGGQGAPLVPIGDKLLFSEYDFCINLGGFANISTELDSQRIAYDICPVNIVLNHYARKLGLDFDNNGHLASTGKIIDSLLSKLNALKYYSQIPPKSLGLEWVNETIFLLIDSYNLQIEDILRTFVEHVSCQISSEIENNKNSNILITGGGVFNKFLINRIKSSAKGQIVIPSKEIIEYKEALIFGFLGVLKLRNQVNCLRSVTGAKKDHSSGKILIV